MRLQPAFALPHARLATLLRGKLPDADLAALEQRLADPELGAGPRPGCCSACAHVLDARGDYARAAACLREANAITLELGKGITMRVRPGRARAVRRRLHASLRTGLLRAHGRLGLDSRRPVFVFGLPRSGTTLIEQVLASHSQVHGRRRAALGAADASRPSPRCWAGPGRPSSACRASTPPRSARLAEQHLELRRWLDGSRADRAIVDKMPDNYMYLGLAGRRSFPGATFIHCRRDLRDVAVSCWMTDFRSIRWANDPEHIATRFQQYRRLMDHWRAVLPVPIHRRRLRGDRDRPGRRWPGGWSRPAAWTGSRPAWSSTAHDRPDPHRQRHPGPPAGLQAVGRPLEELRNHFGRPACRPAK